MQYLSHESLGIRWVKPRRVERQNQDWRLVALATSELLPDRVQESAAINLRVDIRRPTLSGPKGHLVQRADFLLIEQALTFDRERAALRVHQEFRFAFRRPR